MKGCVRPRLAALWTGLVLTGALSSALSRGPSPPDFTPTKAPPLPGETAAWVGAKASWDSLRGRVVLLNVWTFGWINCQRTLPWVREVAHRYRERGLSVVGVHTPEFEAEKVRDNVAAQIRAERLDWPHLLDNDYRYWNALDNHYWPAVYLVDRCGTIRARFIGEIHAGQGSGDRAGAALESLLAESAGC